MTVKEKANQLGIKPTSLQIRIKRKGFKIGLNEEIPEDVEQILLGVEQIHEGIEQIVASPLDKPEQPPPQPLQNISQPLPKQERRYKPAPTKKDFPWDRVMDAMPVIMFGLAASYGVYDYSRHFMPEFFAYVLGGAFEATYIRLGTTKGLRKEERERAKKVSIGAVIISVIYNTVSAKMHTDTGWIHNTNPFIVWMLCLLHGAPMALLGYYIVDLLFHKNNTHAHEQ